MSYSDIFGDGGIVSAMTFVSIMTGYAFTSALEEIGITLLELNLPWLQRYTIHAKAKDQNGQDVIVAIPTGRAIIRAILWLICVLLVPPILLLYRHSFKTPTKN